VNACTVFGPQTSNPHIRKGRHVVPTADMTKYEVPGLRSCSRVMGRIIGNMIFAIRDPNASKDATMEKRAPA